VAVDLRLSGRVTPAASGKTLDLNPLQENSMAGKFEITQSKNGKFLFNLKAGNGQVILTSQMYESKASATQGIESCKTNSALDERFERAKSKADEPYFNLKAGNG
jgi:uncharacterized protein YegP (UPF0339 family)